MVYRYILRHRGGEIMSFTSDTDYVSVLSEYVKIDENSEDGTFSIWVGRDGQEYFEVGGLTKLEGVAIMNELREMNIPFGNGKKMSDVDGDVKLLSNKKKKAVKWFIGVFLFFALVSFGRQLSDYKNMPVGQSILNSVLTLVFIVIILYGAWLFFIKNKRISGDEKVG